VPLVLDDEGLIEEAHAFRSASSLEDVVSIARQMRNGWAGAKVLSTHEAVVDGIYGAAINANEGVGSAPYVRHFLAQIALSDIAPDALGRYEALRP
jgi:hypothetical protein